MSENTFKALLLEKDNDEFKASLKTLSQIAFTL